MLCLIYNYFNNKLLFWRFTLKFTLNEIIMCTDAQILFEKDTDGSFEISTDTRKLQKDNPEKFIYLPLRGENYDGHNFIDKALEMGACAYFTQDKFKVNKNADFVLYVENSLVAYLRLANYIRNKINPKLSRLRARQEKQQQKKCFSAFFQQNTKLTKPF